VKLLYHLALIAQCLALMIWVGGILFFAFIAAPLTFQPDVQAATGGTEVSGKIVSSVLARFAWWESICAAVLILGLLEQMRQARANLGRRLVRLGIALVMMGLMLWYGHVIGPRMRELRAEIGDFNQADVASVAYQEFDTLHRRHTRLMGANLFLGLGLFVITVALVPSAHRDRERGQFHSLPL
jgi:uncharacterized membrane protein